MRTKDDVPTVRRNLSLATSFLAQVTSLRIQTEASSMSCISRSALIVYENFLKITDEKSKLWIPCTDGKKHLITAQNLEDIDGEIFVKTNIIFHLSSIKRLDMIRDKTHAISDSHVIRRSHKLYQLLVEKYCDIIEIEKSDGNFEMTSMMCMPRKAVKTQIPELWK